MTKKPAHSDAKYQAVLELLRVANAILDASRIFFEQWDLGPSQFNVLNLLGDLPDGLSQVELSRQLLTHRSNVTGLVDRLERQNLVKRRQVPGDRRAYRVVLSPEGRKLWRTILPLYLAGASDTAAHLSEEQARRFIEALSGFAQNANRIAARMRDHRKETDHASP